MSDLVKGNKAAVVCWKGKARLRLCVRKLGPAFRTRSAAKGELWLGQHRGGYYRATQRLQLAGDLY